MPQRERETVEQKHAHPVEKELNLPCKWCIIEMPAAVMKLCVMHAASSQSVLDFCHHHHHQAQRLISKQGGKWHCGQVLTFPPNSFHSWSLRVENAFVSVKNIPEREGVQWRSRLTWFLYFAPRKLSSSLFLFQRKSILSSSWPHDLYSSTNFRSIKLIELDYYVELCCSPPDECNSNIPSLSSGFGLHHLPWETSGSAAANCPAMFTSCSLTVYVLLASEQVAHSGFF